MEQIIIHGRPDFADKRFGHTTVKKFPKYVYSSNGNGLLIHKVLRVEARWYDVVPAGLLRRHTPHLTAISVCGQYFYINHGKGYGVACEMPKPDAVLCGRCHGTGPVFRKNPVDIEKRRDAHRKLGCIAEVELREYWIVKDE